MLLRTCNWKNDNLPPSDRYLFRNLCLGLEDLQLVFMISSHDLFIKLLKDDERKLLIDEMRKRSPRINLCTKPVTSFYDIPGNTHCFISLYTCSYTVTSGMEIGADLFSDLFSSLE